MVCAFEGQSAKAAQVLGEDDGVRRVFTGVHFRVDVGEQHGFAGFQHDAADALGRSAVLIAEEGTYAHTDGRCRARALARCDGVDCWFRLRCRAM